MSNLSHAIREQHRVLAERDALFRRHGGDMEASVQFVLRCAAPVTGQVLEIGTGRGHFLVALTRSACRVVTVDPDAEALHGARLYATEAEAADKVEFIHGDAAQLAQPDGAFDAVVSMNALHHIERLEPVLAESLRLLRPGGKLVLADFNAEGFEIVARMHQAEGKVHPAVRHDFARLQVFLEQRGCRTRLEEGCHEKVLLGLTAAVVNGQCDHAEPPTHVGSTTPNLTDAG